MNIWVLVWLGLALTLLYFMGWNMLILYRQKKAWREFSEGESLRFKDGGFAKSPEMNGTYKDYTVSLFTGEHLAPDGRGSRRLAAIEIQLSSKMPFEAALASGGMVSFARELQLNEEVKIDHKGWKKDYIALSNKPAALENYLTSERIEALMTLIRVKNGWVILVFKGDTTLLRFDTADPLDKVGTLRAILNRMVEAAKILELEAGEAARLKDDAKRASPKEKPLQVDEAAFESTPLVLEEGEETQDETPQSENHKEQPD